MERDVLKESVEAGKVEPEESVPDDDFEQLDLTPTIFEQEKASVREKKEKHSKVKESKA